MHSSTVPISSSKGLQAKKPNTATRIPSMQLSVIEVWTVSCASSKRREPIACDTETDAPTDRPMKSPVIRLESEPVELTAPSASLPISQPTTAESDAL